jgi:hypothetical protein
MLRSTFLKSALALVATTGVGLTAVAGGASPARSQGCCCGDHCACEECGCAGGACADCTCEACGCEDCACGSDGCGK